MSDLQYAIQTNFTAGEYSPKMRGRVDFKKYESSCQKLLNFIPQAQGGVTKRGGTYYAAEVKDSSAYTRLIPFRFSTEQNYIIELGNLYMRFYRDRGQVVESSKTITGITVANPGVVTSAAHGYNNGEQVYINDVVGMTQVNGRRFTVANAAANTFEISSTVGYTAYSSGGIAERIYEVATPWTTAQLEQIKFTQSADTLFVVHPEVQPQVITRTSDTDWTIDDFEFLDGPYMDQNTDGTTMTIAATTGTNINLHMGSAPAGVQFEPTDVGRLIRIYHASPAGWGYAKIISYTDADDVQVDIIEDFTSAGAPVTTWRFGAWSDTTGWPSVVTFFQQRLVFAATPDMPQTIWGSKTNDYNNFEPTDASGTVFDTNGFTFTIADTQVNAIRWMQAGKAVLQVGTSDSEHQVYGGTSAGTAAVTPSNVSISSDTSYGSAETVRAHKVGNTVIFVQPSGRKVRASIYDYKYDGYVASDITLPAEHITLFGVVDFDYQEEIIPTAWFALASGELVGFTYEQEQDVMAWHRHLIGGNGAVESVSVIPAPDLTRGDDLWLSVLRTINGSTKRYVEYINSPFEPDLDGQSSGFFVDGGISYNGYLDGTVTPGATTGTGITFTASTSVFTPSMVGRKIYQFSEDNELEIIGRATITAYTSGTQVTCTITDAFPAATAITNGYWAVAAQTLTGFNHLDGEAIQPCVDGATHPDVTPALGIITLNDFYAEVHAGFSYASDIKLWPPEGATRSRATSQGVEKKITEVTFGLLNTTYLEYGPDFDNLEPLLFRKASDLMNAAVPLFTGIKRGNPISRIDTEPTVCVRADKVLPCNILFIEQKVENYG